MSSSAAPSSGPLSSATPHIPVGATSGSLLAPEREPAFLDLDFQATARPWLITHLLALVTPGEANDDARIEESPLWNLSVATRLKRLLHVVRDTTGLSALSLRLRCPHDDCQQFLEIDLPLADLDALHDEASDRELMRFPGSNSRPIAFRRPTGNDLRLWRSSTDSSVLSQETVLRSLLVSEAPSAEPIELPSAEACATAFSEFDSLVAFQLTTTCPHCGRESIHGIDLETLALNRLSALQQRLYSENHQLARAYGWSEADILRVPRTRRLRYLAHLEDSP